MSRMLAAAALALAVTAVPLFADERTFEGAWTNRKFRTNGVMKCVATPGENGMWKATFSGNFQGRPYSYDVEFQSRPGQGQTAFAGTAKIQNHNYEWAGALKGDTLTGRYRADNGYFGEFVLKEKGKK